MDHRAQLEILADALTRITDLASLSNATTRGATAPELLDRAGDIAAEALGAAATFGALPEITSDECSLHWRH